MRPVRYGDTGSNRRAMARASHGDTEMTAYLKLYAVSIVAFLALDAVWLGVA